MKKETVTEITVEDIDEIMSEGRDFIVPLVINYDISGKDNVLYLEVYSDALKIAKKFVKKYENKWFDERSLSVLFESFDKYFKKHGYIPQTEGANSYYINYSRSLPLNEDERTHILESTVKMNDSLKDMINVSGLTADDCYMIPDESFVTVCDGKIVSVATVNDHDVNSRVIEITVETSPDYRSLGFGKSNVLALTEYLINKGCRVAYCTENDNICSNAIAVKCGFAFIGNMYAVCGYKDC